MAKATRKLNDILKHSKDRVAFIAHVVPTMPETRIRDPEQRSRVMAVEMRLIEVNFRNPEKS